MWSLRGSFSTMYYINLHLTFDLVKSNDYVFVTVICQKSARCGAAYFN